MFKIQRTTKFSKIFKLEKVRYKGFITQLKRKLFYPREYEPIVVKDDKLQKIKTFLSVNNSKLNSDKIFYVIQRHPGYGLFSNVSFVINHLKVAKDHGFIPVVDMENYTTVYNEREKVCNTFNAWEYYFEQTSNFTLEEVYNSKNVIITDSIFYDKGKNFYHSIVKSDELLKIAQEKLVLKKSKFELVKKLKKKLFKNKKILGVHFRGTGFKMTGTVYALTVSQMTQVIEYCLKDGKYDKIFLVTEDQNNFEEIVKIYKDKVIFLKQSLKAKDSDYVFDNYLRLSHRYKLGRDILLETYLMSYCDGLASIKTNPFEMACALNLNPQQKRYLVENKFNKNYPVINRFIWHIKKILPEKLGGFKKIPDIKLI
tara:strand:+ start:1123 stop:2232 length:1110 start_codon:yes stop_codon:yes gene_type:complete